MYKCINVIVSKKVFFDLINKSTIFTSDNKIYQHIRNNIDDFINTTIINHNKHHILEVGPNNDFP